MFYERKRAFGRSVHVIVLESIQGKCGKIINTKGKTEREEKSKGAGGGKKRIGGIPLKKLIFKRAGQFR